MCGIFGIFGQHEPGSGDRILSLLAHRGPDGRGLHRHASGLLGHTRLSILDLEGGHQPMTHQETSISYNGEVYNYRELQAEHLPGLKPQGHSDTEVLLHLYRKLGPGMVSLLDGMFALAILHGDELFLARDPLGIKPLYYGFSHGCLHFASEIRALGVACDEVREFPAGHWYHSRLGWHAHYSLPDRPGSFTGDEESARAAIRSVLARSVRKRLLADVPVGVALSGGLDSSIIALLAAAETPKLHTFAVGMEGSSDLAAARMLSQRLGTLHHEHIYTEADMLMVLPEVVKHLESSDAALVRSAVPNYFLARLTSRHVKVMLTGEGADELYAGYDYMAGISDPLALQAELVRSTGALHNTNLQRADRLSMAFGLEARVPFLDRESVELALSLPPEWKLRRDRCAKHTLREAFRGLLPDAIVDRPKLKFSKGAGSSGVLRQRAERQVSDQELESERMRLASSCPRLLHSKESLLYHRLLLGELREHWVLPSLGLSASL